MSDSPVLVLDSLDQDRLPLHFRRADGPFTRPGAPLPTRQGLDRLRLSGSHQFSRGELARLARELPPGAVVVDLRQESHGFVNGTAVSWFVPKDFGNEGRTTEEIDADEKTRLADLAQQGRALILEVLAKDDAGLISSSREIRERVDSAWTEAELIRSVGFEPVRLPVRDHSRPSDDAVERYLAFRAGIAPGSWLHFHCHAGEGRTTVFLAMEDMLVNACEVGFEDIVRRQGMLGGLDLLLSTPGWKRPYAVERREFLRAFHAYARANPGGRPLNWSRWLATRCSCPEAPVPHRGRPVCPPA